MKLALEHKIFNIIKEITFAEGKTAYVIGGYVRDLLLERPSTDIDIVAVGSGIELAQKVAEKIGANTQVAVFKNFGTAMLRYQDWDIEFVGARKESYNRNSRKPVVENGTLEDDQNRRDFTINTLAISLSKENYGELIDPFNGINDLHDKIIRTPLDPDITFSDDPLRMIRAIRFAAQLNFKIEPRTLMSIAANKDRMGIVSQERIVEELNKIIMSPKPSIGFNLLEKTGLLELVFPELAKLKGVEVIDGMGHKDNLDHTIKVLDNISKKNGDLWLRWAALLHDIAKPQTKRYIARQGWTFYGHELVGSKMVVGIFKNLRLPLNQKMKYVQKLVVLHLRPIALTEEEVTDSAVRRLLFDAGEEIDDLMALCEADITSKNEEKIKTHLKNFKLVRAKLKEVEEKDAVRNWQPPITGDDIMKYFNIAPSREIGVIKTAIKDAIMDGKIPNSYEAALQFMIEKGREIGLKAQG